ncbi:MAG: radical SAM protein, partial [Kiritimatiellaceae bacterium]|nr:radical SAM protein [Kiritimatiellaceae bacterium]
LSAPTELHFSFTNKCSAGCTHCYTNSVPDAKEEFTLEDMKKHIDRLADFGVFHIALGGGESLERDDIFEIAAYIRTKNMVPNLTTSGLPMTPEMAKRCNIFGQINVSIDSLIPDPSQPRLAAHLQKSMEALKMLIQHGNKTGINCVINRYNYDQIPAILKFAKENKLADVEFLRLKSSGRATFSIFNNLNCTPEQHRDFWPTLLKYSKKYKQDVKIDCSYVPMMAYHSPDKKLMEKFCVKGCDGGNLLAAADHKGRVKACSFSHEFAGKLEDIRDEWGKNENFLKYVNWSKSAIEPCKSCNYLSLCKGGCHVVAETVNNDFFSPDPECPKVYAYNQRKKAEASQ